MRYLMLVHPEQESRNEIVRIQEDDAKSVGGTPMEELVVNDLMRLSTWDGGTIEIREATFVEVSELDDLEQEQEAGEPDVGFHYPEDHNKICALLRAWTSPLTTDEIMQEIVNLCDIQCRGPETTFRYLQTKFGERIRSENRLRAFIAVLNFPAIRENRENLKFL